MFINDNCYSSLIRRKRVKDAFSLPLVSDIKWLIYICEICIFSTIYITILGFQITVFFFRIQALTVVGISKLVIYLQWN